VLEVLAEVAAVLEVAVAAVHNTQPVALVLPSLQSRLIS
jgi:hypothetical protein